MIIEIKTARTWQIWIDGVCPVREWSISEAEEVEGSGDHAETFYRYTTAQQRNIGDPMPWPPLKFPSPLPGSSSEMSLEWIAFDVPDNDWVTDIDGTKIGPTEAFVKFEGEDPIYLKVTECWYLGENDAGPAPKGVQLENKVWLEIDEVTAYVRLETEEGR